MLFQFNQETKEKQRELNYHCNSNRDCNRHSNHNKCKHRKVKIHELGRIKYQVTHPSNGLSTLSLHCNECILIFPSDELIQMSAVVLIQSGNKEKLRESNCNSDCDCNSDVDSNSNHSQWKHHTNK